MTNEIQHNPGDQAPVSGIYRLVNVFGSLTDQRIRASQGQALPDAPVGHTWRLERPTDGE